MTDLKFEILERLYLESEKTHISESELLNPFVSKKNNDVNSAKHALNQMIEQGYVYRLSPGEYRIAVKGIDIYEAEYAAQGDRKSNRIRANWALAVSIIGMLISAVSLINKLFF